MPQLIVALVPLMLGSTLVLTWISLIVLLLRMPHGIARASAFTIAITVVRLLQGLGGSTAVERFANGFEVRFLVSILLLPAGLMLVLVGVRALATHNGAPRPPERLLRLVKDAGVVKCALVGAMLMLLSPRQWVLTLSAAAMIESAQLPLAQEVIAFLIFTAGAQSLMIAPIILRVTGHGDGDRPPGAFRLFFARHGRQVTGVVAILVGGYFLWRGVADLFIS